MFGNRSTYNNIAPTSVVYSQDGALYVFWVGTDTHIYYQKTYDGATWYGPNQAGNGTTNAQVAVASFQNRLYVFIKGGDNHVYYNTGDGVNWTGYTDLGAMTNAPLATAPHSDRLNLYLKGETNNRVYYTAFNGSSWSGYQPVAGNGYTFQGLGACTSDRYQSGLFLVGTDGGIYMNINNSGNFYNDYFGISGSGQYTDAPVSALYYTNQVYYVFSKEYGYVPNPYNSSYGPLAGYVRWFTGNPAPNHLFDNRGFIRASQVARSGYDGATYTTPSCIAYAGKIFIFITGPNNQYDSPWSPGTIFQSES